MKAEARQRGAAGLRSWPSSIVSCASGPPPISHNQKLLIAVEVIEQCLEEIRPLYGRDGHRALWLTARRRDFAVCIRRFAAYRDDLGLLGELTSADHSY